LSWILRPIVFFASGTQFSDVTCLLEKRQAILFGWEFLQARNTPTNADNEALKG
jgi:hypothetical protein